MTREKHKPQRGWHRKSEALRISSLFPAQEKQRYRLNERRIAKTIRVSLSETEFEIFPGVYQTSVDTQLMSESIKLTPKETFLEIGCGCGAVSLLSAQRSRFGLGVDINPIAIQNSIW